ncbi:MULTISPECIES: saccharopine dehydrogenase family protein [Catenuloplanes]|uniref:Short subunit dehydrogenase-like uncharacterized protein n=1 Tax=Catenuloplanes niger TaxID=587534 RepID=A0AAE4CZ67_9ACTN|nr:saccharopine dehydrogenase NADP-binding domain-containing protein [Catenuloplanes niger]MDR7326609.1 short subunit dehydrogenase-like uncharacterized protein [Catenuloplanes niger]
MADHDVVVHGATGFAGFLVAEHLAAHAPAGLRIALGGRSAARLAEARRRLGVDWPVIVADATDDVALRALARSARVVVTTVGPYVQHGHGLVRACAEAGTHYADLTGEVLFVRRSIDDNHEPARRTGARIVHSCGWDSIPSDLGVHVLHAAAGAELTDTTLVVTAARGGVSGGTIDTMRRQLDMVRADRALRRVAADPYALSPDRAVEPDLGRQPDLISMPGRTLGLRGTLAPFIMAVHNTRVVRRSNALHSYAYGRTFRYREVISTGTSALSPLLAAGVRAGMAALLAGLLLPPTRFVLDRLAPRPGSGPSERARRDGHFTMDLFATTRAGTRYRARFRMQGDPGYAATAVMLGETALALAVDTGRLPASGGGVLTPATALGDVLVDRLRAAGAEITAGPRR